MKVQIYVAAHKPYQMPQDPTYRPNSDVLDLEELSCGC